MSIIFLDEVKKQAWEDSVEELKSINITHAVICYRTDSGDLCYRVYGEEHVTFLIGMLDRIKHQIHCLNSVKLNDIEEGE